MTSALSSFGNDLHAGRRSFPIVRRRRTWYLISLVVLVILGGLAFLRGPNLGIEFTGGSEFQIAGVQETDQTIARDIVRERLPENEPKITVLGEDTMRVQTERLDSGATSAMAQELAAGYGVQSSDVSTSYVGAVWSGDITQKMLRGVVAFLVLVALTMALYFRNLKTSLAAMLALLHDILITVGVYLVVGFEITPATVIGFLTILGYSLYDTIVVFDKVRENIDGITDQVGDTFAERVELAANQTLVRSINTSVVALLPVGAILAIGAFLLGAGTLKDISLALFVGILAGTYSSIFLAPGMLVDLRRREPELAAHTQRVLRRRGTGEFTDPVPADPGTTGAPDDESAGTDSPDDAGDPTEADDSPGPDVPADHRDDAGPADTAEPAGGSHPAEVRSRTQPRRTPRRRRTAPRRGQP